MRMRNPYAQCPCCHMTKDHFDDNCPLKDRTMKQAYALRDTPDLPHCCRKEHKRGNRAANGQGSAPGP